MRAAGVVLAAGAGSRFGGGKLVAPLGGRPVLQRVLDAVAAAGLDDVVVVLGDDAPDIEAAISWRDERRVVNAHPEAGLSSSLRVGLRALPGEVEIALIVLGDQPLVRPETIRELVATAARVEPPVIVPRYSADESRNPVALRRTAWSLADEASGDRGLGPVLSAHPGLVAVVDVAGANPDVDTPADLDAVAVRLADAPSAAHRVAGSTRHG